MNNGFTCRSCGHGGGESVIDLGMQPLANNLLTAADLEKTEPRFPLEVFVCPACWMMQITETVPPVELFSDYVYFSSFSDAMLEHARLAVESHEQEFDLDGESHVVEIASNDGYLLRNFVAKGIPCLGIEPARNIAAVAEERGVPTLTEFFTLALAKEQQPADLILGNNVFAHVPEPNDFVAGLAAMLKPSGRIVLEFPYAVKLLADLEFDTIYHEHVFYFTLTALRPLFERHGLEIFRVREQPIHGGSLRLLAGHKGEHEIDSSVPTTLEQETALGVNSTEYYRTFASRVGELRGQLRDELLRLRDAGKRVAAYGASAKGSTLLNYYGLTADDLEFVADRSPHKQGRLTPGSHISIVPAEELLTRQPDYALLLAWNFADEILLQQQSYRDAGGCFILPLPEVKIV